MGSRAGAKFDEQGNLSNLEEMRARHGARFRAFARSPSSCSIKRAPCTQTTCRPEPQECPARPILLQWPAMTQNRPPGIGPWNGRGYLIVVWPWQAFTQRLNAEKTRRNASAEQGWRQTKQPVPCSGTLRGSGDSWPSRQIRLVESWRRKCHADFLPCSPCRGLRRRKRR
jgi:hypothetical protein